MINYRKIFFDAHYVMGSMRDQAVLTQTIDLLKGLGVEITE